MGAYTDQLVNNLKYHLKNSGWELATHRDTIHLILPEGVKIDPSFNQIYEVLEALPEINRPREEVDITIREHGWSHYYQTTINPGPKHPRLNKNLSF